MTPSPDEVLRMAREAGMDAMVGTVRDGKYEPKVNALKHSVPVEWLEQFAVLTIADFLQRALQYVTNDATRAAVVAEAVAAEREACAKVCEDMAKAFAHDAEHGDHLEWQRQVRRTCSAASAACGDSIRRQGAPLDPCGFGFKDAAQKKEFYEWLATQKAGA